MSTNPFWWVRSSPQQAVLSRITKRNAFPLTTTTCTVFAIGYYPTVARMSVWNPPANIGCLCSTFLKNEALPLPLPIPNGWKPLRVTKTIQKIPNGSGICFASVLFPVALFPQRRFVYFESLLATVTSWFLWKAVRKTDFKTLLPFAMLHLDSVRFGYVR